ARAVLGTERELEPALAGIAYQELLDQERRVGERFRGCAGQQRGQLVAQAEEARGLEADHRGPALDVRRDRREKAPGLAPCLVDHARREICPSAAEGAAPVLRAR